jgi:hypothetical protein
MLNIKSFDYILQDESNVTLTTEKNKYIKTINRFTSHIKTRPLYYLKFKFNPLIKYLTPESYNDITK